MKKLMYIAASPGTVRSFLVERMLYFSGVYEVSAVCSPGAEHEEFHQRGIVTHTVPLARRISPLHDLVSLVRLYRLLKRERPDAVHALTPKAALLGMVAAWAADVPVRIAMFNGELNLTGKITRAAVRITNALTCYFATHINADGYGTREYVLEQGVTRKPVTVLWNGNINGIDLVQFSRKGKGQRVKIRASLGISESSIVYVYVGRIVHDKGIDELISAFVELKKKNLDIALVLIGKEERQLDPISENARYLMNNTEGIHAVGCQDNVPEWLEAGDVFVLPSHREGCSCSLLEAVAMELPCIATDIRGCRDVVQHGINGLLFRARDQVALRKAMVQLYESESLRHQLSSQSRSYVEKNFNRNDVWRELEVFYSSII